MAATIHWLALMLLAGMLAAATLTDLRQHRIPNSLSLGGAGAALACAGLAGGGAGGLLWALAGLLVGLVSFLPFYALGITGAGDVKLMAAVGAFLGPMNVLAAIVCTVIAGAVLGLLVLFRHDGVAETLRRYTFGLKHWVRSGVWLGMPRSQGRSAALLRFPYALAISTGTLAALLLPTSGLFK